MSNTIRYGCGGDCNNCAGCTRMLQDETVVRKNDVVKIALMRDPTPEERKSVNDYIDSISENTNINFFQPHKKVGEMISMSVIEDIKAEIKQTLDADWSDGLYQALRIIDKHISGKEQE